MGGTPILALAILGMPLGKLPIEVARDILAGGAAACAGAGIPVAGGHSIDTLEPIYGLAVIGTARPEQSAATPARARRCADPDQGDRRRIIQCPAQRSAGRRRICRDAGLHHAAEPRRRDARHPGGGPRGHRRDRLRPARPRPGDGARQRATLRITAPAVPFLSRAQALADSGFVTGASHRNWTAYGAGVVLPRRSRRRCATC